MGCCNGRKNRVKPAGTAAREARAARSQDRSAIESSSTTLGRRRTETFEVKSKSGKTLTFHSKLEAKAEIARNGGILKF